MINRREFVAGASAAAGALALRKVNAATPKAATKPNLVYVFADQLRWDRCGFNGDAHAKTPNMDRLAEQGCNVAQAISSTPVCAPYRASLQTGKYQSGTGMITNEIRLSPEHETFGGALKKNGYQTAYIGKWHMWAAQFSHHDLVKNGFVPPGKYRLGFDDHWEAYNYEHTYFRSPYFLDDATPHLRSRYEPDEQTDSAINYLKSRQGKDDPFALFLSWGPPHPSWANNNVDPAYLQQFADLNLPLPPNFSSVSDPYADNWSKIPADYEARVRKWMPVYYAQTANLDMNLGRLMKAMDDLGLTDNTIFVFTCDHGEMFGAHGRQAKLIFYEEACRVPFLMRWPGKLKAGSRSETLLGTPDIMPTLLRMMNVPCPTSIEGQDLSSHILRNTGVAPAMAHMQGMGATAAWTDGSEWRAARDHEFTYGVYHVDGKELLFNNRKDPWQMHNLAEDRGSAATLRHYREASATFRKEHNDEFHECSWYEKHWTIDRNITDTATGTRHNLQELNELLAKWFPGDSGGKSVRPDNPSMG